MSFASSGNPICYDALGLLTIIYISSNNSYNYMKNMRICYSLFLILFLFATASAQYVTETPAGNMNATALKELITESERNLEVYRFTLAQDEQVERINLTTGSTINQARLITLGSGAFNLTAKATKVITALLSYPVGQEENAISMANEVYVLNNTIYSKVNGNWTAVNLPLPESVWTTQNRLNQSAELANASDIRLLGTEVIDGEGVYVVEVIPKMGAISSLISNQLGPGFSISSINLSALFNNTEVRYIIWISMDSHVPVAEYVQTNITINSRALGLSGRGNIVNHIDSVTTLEFRGFNESVNIVLPQQAMQAEMLPLTGAQISPSGSAISQGASPLDPPSPSYTNALTPDMQQQLWLAEAYAFLNGGSYPYNNPIYGSPNMAYYAGSYYPYYIPYYYTYPMNYAPYTFPAQGYITPTQGYATTTPGYTTPAQGYATTTSGYTTPTQGYTTPTQGYTTSVPEYTMMTAGNSSIGTYLTDGRGMTLYHLLSDQGSYTSRCTDATCTGIWPPFYVRSINVPVNLNPADFSTITVNGYKQYQQTTYKGWPLYYFYRDARPGDIYGQGLSDSYGIWSVVNPEITNTFPTNFQYQSVGAAATQYQYPTQQPSTVTISPSPPAYTTPSLYPSVPTLRLVTTPVSGNVPVTISYPGSGPFDVYLDGNYIGTGSGGSFSFNAPAGTHNVRVWDGSFDYEQSVLFQNGVPKIIYVQAV